LSWREWTYAEWNRRLLEHVLCGEGSILQEPVERIPATPEELLSVVQDLAAAPEEVQAAFVGAVKQQLPFGEESFSGFCLEFGAWTEKSPNYPRFFGMLWFTCLVAYGYPQPELPFYERVWAALGKKDNLQYQDGPHHPSCLPVLWRLLRDWTLNRRRAGVGIRELLLPLDVGGRKAMGFSWFLAFPHQRDRLELSKCLWESQLIGPEPPIEPVIAALQTNRDRFSPEFREDLDDFVKGVLKAAGEAKSSAFWRALRQEALHPSATSDGARLESKPQAGVVVFGGEDGLRPVLCGPSEWRAPAEYDRIELEEPVGNFTYYFTKNGELSEPAERALVLGELVGFAHRSLIQQGLLVLRDVGADVYAVVSGTEVNGATLALARDDRTEPFVTAFGGTITRGLIDGWWEISGCRVHKLKELTAGLAGATQLLATMQPPTISVAGGIRVPEGFYRFDAFLPHVHAYDAERVWVQRGDVQIDCQRRTEPGEWSIPADGVPSAGEVVVRAEWPQDGGSARLAETRLVFVDWVINDELKPLRSGSYVLEGCGVPELQATGGTPIAPDLRTDDPNDSADLLELEGSVRYLGPGLGEMSLQPQPGFDWMVIGPNKQPDVAVYVGDLEKPTPPANRRSPDGGDRRHWKQGMGARALVRVARGKYQPIEEFPLLAKCRAEYKAHDPGSDAVECAATNLRALEAPAGLFARPASETQQALNALTALSVRKGGLSYKEVSALIEPLLGESNPLAVQQLLRAWSECGMLDVVRHSVSGRMTIIAAAPGLIRVRRGHEVEATVVGLMSEHRVHRLLDALRDVPALRHVEVRPPNQFQPSVHRLRGRTSDIDRAAAAAGIGTGGWLRWPNPSEPPDVFSVQQAFERLPSESHPPPRSYRLNATWDWKNLVFDRRHLDHSQAGVQIQRRSHNDGTSIYVVLSDGKIACWSYLRNWALVFGYELAGERPFRRDSRDTLSCAGLSPLHLPLPIARLCTLVGDGLPGPQLRDKVVLGYSYPFGRRLYRLIEKVIPPAWIRTGA
jgi:hypothetical protein